MIEVAERKSRPMSSKLGDRTGVCQTGERTDIHNHIHKEVSVAVTTTACSLSNIRW